MNSLKSCAVCSHRPDLGALVRITVIGFVFSAVACLSVLPAAASNAEEIEPADVYALVSQLAGEVEILRGEMGAPQFNGEQFQVAGARPRQVFYQAEVLKERINRLASEQIGLRTGSGSTPNRAGLEPSDVYAQVERSLNTTHQIGKSFGISGHSCAHRPLAGRGRAQPVDDSAIAAAVTGPAPTRHLN
jgi:hypothetical protein